MKRYLVPLAAAAALSIPAAALADSTTPTAGDLAAQSCKTQQTQLGATFKTTYGTNASKSNAYGKCVSKAMQAARAALQNAAQSCKAEQADATFATTHGKTFDAFYGGNSAKGKGAGANAYGMCVSTKAKAATQTQTQATVTAAKACKTERSADTAAFAKKYASFGACVSTKTKGS